MKIQGMGNNLLNIPESWDPSENLFSDPAVAD
jgi:hypothetical protein